MRSIIHRATREIPTERYESAQAFAAAEKLGVSSGTAALRESVVELGAGLDSLKTGIQKLEEALGLASDAAVLAAMQSLRTTVDLLEKRVSSSRWPLPKYRDMLFLY